VRVLCIYQFFSTGNTPDTLRPLRLCKRLADAGHDVVVISTDFSRHSGESEGPTKEIVETKGRPLTILRVPSTRDYRKGLFNRFLNYAGFSLRTLIKGLQIGDVDIVLTSIPPTFVGPVGWLIAKIRGKPFFLEVRDLWPDALEVKGAVRNKLLLKLLYGISNFLYQQACFIVSLTYGIKAEIAKKGINPRHIAVLPNGMDPELFANIGETDDVRNKWGWGTDFVAVYIGTLVEVTSMDTVVEAAERLRHVPGIRFEIFGSGSTEAALQRMIREKGLTNCRFNGTVAKKDVPSILKAADVCLMCLFETPLAHIYFQNKFFDYMGAGKPIVAAMRGHQQEIIDHVGAGFCKAPKDSTGLADAVRYLFEKPDAARRMGMRGQHYAQTHFCLDDILVRYADLITACATGRTPSVAPDARPPLPGALN
jgi:glycosyltransferase involved in cell wall biosynthesis